MHAVTGAWVSGLALILLLSGLPWTQVWSSGFNMLRAEMGWVNQQEQDWRSVKPITKQHIDMQYLHREHDHTEMLRSVNKKQGNDFIRGISLQKLHDIAQGERLHHPIIIKPNNDIHNNQNFFPQEWQISSQTQNRPLRKSIFVNGTDGDIIARSDFADRHIIDQFISYGIAWHEGQLLGWFNQLIGVLTAFALMLLCYSGIKIWWLRRPKRLNNLPNNSLVNNHAIFDKIGAPIVGDTRPMLKVTYIFLLLCVVILPLFGATFIIIFLLDHAVTYSKNNKVK